MFIFNSKKVTLYISLLLSVSNTYANDIDLGKNLTDKEVQKYSITVFTDGKGLPKSEGNAIQGKKTYENKCAMCHGLTGVEGPATRLVGPAGPEGSSDPLAALSVGAWPYATTIYDYIHRAMPLSNPKSLSDKEVYGLTAYILYLNDIVSKKEVLNQETLPKVKMPYQNKTINIWEKERQDKLKP